MAEAGERAQGGVGPTAAGRGDDVHGTGDGSPNSLSDEKLALELRSDLPLMRFIGVNTNFGTPRARTLWTCRVTLGEAIEDLFA